MGDLPLRTPTDRRHGGPSPRRQTNRTHRHPPPTNLYSQRDAPIGNHRVLILLSEGYPRAAGRFDTCYAPVRRSPSTSASTCHAAPRLACVKPVASVHPEPGSNSPLYILLYLLFCSATSRRTMAGREPRCMKGWTRASGLSCIISCHIVSLLNRRFDSHFLYYFLVYGNMSNISCRNGNFPVCGCKGTATFPTDQIF